MIAKMKKLSILASGKDVHALTHSLRELGVLHLNTMEERNVSIEEIRNKEALVQRALEAIPEAPKKASGKGGKKSARALADPNPPTATTQADSPAPEKLPEAVDPEKLATEIAERARMLKEKEKEIDFLNREIARCEVWGNFDPALLSDIATSPYNAGFEPSLVALSAQQAKAIPATCSYMKLKKHKKTAYFVFFTPPQELRSLGYEPFAPPQQSLSEMREALAALSAEREQELNALATRQNDKKTLQSYSDQLAQDSEYACVEASLKPIAELPSIVRINGFVPSASLPDLKNFASEQGAALVIQDPDPSDTVPTELKNPKPLRIIEPMFKFMDTLPGYSEQDISLWFLLFFTLFFAMIIGDAGYGALLTLASVVLMLRSKRTSGKVSQVSVLALVLGLGTLFWGAVSANWFGYAPIGALPFFQRFAIPNLNAFAEGAAQERVVQTLLLFCFGLGLGHLVLAHFLSFVKKLSEKPRIHGLADAGWIMALVGLFFLVLNLVVDATAFPIPAVALPLIIAGLVSVLLFDGQEGDGFFRGIARTMNVGNLIYTALTAISSFADIISYIRLFAVGLASVEIARSFNIMAEGILSAGGGGLFSVIGAIIVLFLGHSLNVVMGGLSVLVHGIRLKMLEFSGHLGNEWTGFAYKPFRKTL